MHELRALQVLRSLLGEARAVLKRNSLGGCVGSARRCAPVIQLALLRLDDSGLICDDHELHAVARA
jgi:hypothetical protein